MNTAPKKKPHLFGQWIGEFKGDDSSPNLIFPGKAAFCIEYDQTDIGFAYIDQGSPIHGSRKDFKIKIEGNRITGHAISSSAFDFNTNQVIPLEESVKRLKTQGKDVFYTTNLEFDGSIDEQTVKCKFRGENAEKKVTGYFEGHKLSQNKPSPPDQTKTWQEFKNFISEQIKTGVKFIFRGQPSNLHRLNTSFHRQRRYDLARYEIEACHQLVQHINAISTRQYDLKNSIDFGALLSLAQHHGFPTPLLDWTASPYIAAFFAFDKCSTFECDINPRIYIFNSKDWQKDTTQAAHLADPRLVITIREFIAANNPRHLPQQSIHTYSNIEDIEAWIRMKEIENKKTYLTIIDIPKSERKHAMQDLAYMGVTAGSLFPGLDGVCCSLKERFFPPH